MELKTAKLILEALADGVDPATGEALPPGSLLESPDVIRALHVAVAAIDSRIQRLERSSALPGNAGKSWAPENDRELIAMFDSGTPVAAIAQAFQRTRGAIESRLMRLGKLSER